MTESEVHLSPVAIENAIRECANRIAKGVMECNKRYEIFLKADRDYDRAYAMAFLRYDGPAHSKRYHAEVETYAEREARDVADASYRHADRLSRALQDELRSLQSVGASVRQAYSVAGRGEN